jgi:RNA-directed DNA polymerase
MYVLEESDCAIVPMKLTHREDKTSAEPAEGRAQTKENDAQPHMRPTQSGVRVSQGLGGVRQKARAGKQERFTALLHHLTIDLLRESYYALQRSASPGVDGVSWQQYEQDLEARLIELHGRMHRGAYRAQASRRILVTESW